MSQDEPFRAPVSAVFRSASIVIVSSVVGLVGHAGGTAYASVKAAMVSLVRLFAKKGCDVVHWDSV